ncbi:hypothetical protein FE257_000849 [Aspergillus nanangensis]|uniref:Xylanolytic transcriptional activator regulatory domain-containing protein n=1 Tax=Aspergillus nanangensis TaxID=2582783 RepID=A0AAD4GQ13_ASPNN|nr:hypothetical protein FE257_000849 [Aspergillus nanangensis]
MVVSNPMEPPQQSDKEPLPTPIADKRKRHPRAANYPRKRATRACATCRLRRTKCDNSRPSFDPASLAILKRIDDLESLVKARTSDAASPFAPSKILASSASPLIPFADIASPSPSLSSPVGDQQMQWKPCFINIDEVLKWPVFLDHQDLEQRLRRLAPLEEEEDNNSQPELPISIVLDFNAADRLLGSFFRNVHIFNPTLKEDNIREHVKNALFKGIGWDAMSCLLNTHQLLIYAHGLIATPFTMDRQGTSSSSFRQSKEFLQAESYFRSAQMRMGMLLCKSGTIEAQCFFLAGVYLMSTLRPVGAWRMFVQALACCQGFFIHQTSDYDEDWDTKQRIYWTCLKSELELRLELNLPQEKALDLSYPSFFPSPPEGLKSEDEAAWYFYLAEIALRRLKNRILGYLYQHDATNPESNMEEVILDFEAQADAWLRSLPPSLALNTDVPNKDQYQPFRFILSGHFLDCQETIYWHFLVETMHGRVHGNRNNFLQKGLQVCLDRVHQNHTGFYHRHHGTWLMLRSCTRSAFVLLAAERRVELVPFLPIGWQEAVFEVSKMLAFWKDESRDVAELFAILQTLLEAREQQ